MGQAPIASTESFRIVFEGLVGRNTLGNIAIDDISISPGVCPTAPQVSFKLVGIWYLLWYIILSYLVFISTNNVGCCYWSRRLCFWGWWVRVKSHNNFHFWFLNLIHKSTFFTFSGGATLMLGTQLTSWTGKGRLRLTAVVIRLLTIQLARREASSCRSPILDSFFIFFHIPLTAGFQREHPECWGSRVPCLAGDGRDNKTSMHELLVLHVWAHCRHHRSLDGCSRWRYEASILAFTLHIHRSQSGKTCSVDKNNQPSGPAGNDSKNVFFFDFKIKLSKVMTPVWRLHNGRGPSWQYGQAQVTTETSFQVIFFYCPFILLAFLLYLWLYFIFFLGYNWGNLGE